MTLAIPYGIATSTNGDNPMAQRVEIQPIDDIEGVPRHILDAYGAAHWRVDPSGERWSDE